jgi:hypothetical protein
VVTTDLFDNDPVRPDDVKRLLGRTGDIIERGWCQHVSAKDKYGGEVRISDPEAVCFCLTGAVYKAADDHKFSEIIAAACCRALREAIDNQRIPLWNDSPWRIKEDVVRAIERAKQPRYIEAGIQEAIFLHRKSKT